MGYFPDPPEGFLPGPAPRRDDDLPEAPPGFRPGPAPPTWADTIREFGQGMATPILQSVSDVVGLPHSVGQLGDVLINKWARDRPVDPETLPTMGPVPDQGPGFLTRHWVPPEDVNKAIFGNLSAASQATGGKPVEPYEATSDLGKIGQAGLRQVIPSLIGPVEGLLGREIAGTAGGAGGEAYRQLRPNAPWWEQMAATVASGAGALGATSSAKQGTNFVRGLLDPEFAKTQQEANVAGAVARAGGQPGSQIAATINQNLPQWTPGARPDLGNVTELPGHRAMVYQDREAAKGKSPIYSQMDSDTNVAQRGAVAGATPSDADIVAQRLAAQRDAALGQLPAGMSAQTAGTQFRTGLRTVQEQRQTAQAAAGDMFDVLDTTPRQTNLRPSMDFATEKAAMNAGEVGEAYNRALGQFKSATGVTLDTPAFANSVLKGLTDLAGNYDKGSAGARAVNEVKAHLSAALEAQVPEIGDARRAYAAASRPLDVFDQAPFGKVLKTGRYGDRYELPAESVVTEFLTGQGSAQAHRDFRSIFQNPEQETRALQEFIAGQVREKAVAADGTIDLKVLQKTLNPYQGALMHYPQLQRQFSTARGAQEALNQQNSYQRLYNTVSHELGTPELDEAKSAMYSRTKFPDFVQKNDALIDQAYTPEQAAAVRRVAEELTNIDQTRFARSAGTSGTAQLVGKAIEKAGPFGLHGGALAGGTGYILGHIVESLLPDVIPPGVGQAIGSIGGSLLGASKEARTAAFEAVKRNALTDPAYARALMVKYDPSGLNTPAAVRAMEYIQSRTPWLAATTGAANATQPQQPPMSYRVAPTSQVPMR